ncbi:MAG: hypothetical protein H6585_08055 [Flavobacteriales bacterium]|nr:hypothetical protein [Flavobacteriales bacterium]
MIRYLLLLLLPSMLYAQEQLNYHLRDARPNADVQRQVTSAFRQLTNGEEVVFDLLLKKEKRQLSLQQQASLARARSTMLVEYCDDVMQLTPNQVMVTTVPFSCSNNPASASNASYRQFATASSGISQLVLTKSDDLFLYTGVTDSLPQDDAQVFTLDPNQSALVIGRNGTHVIFREHAFRLDEDSVCDLVTLKLWEFYTPEQIVMGGMTTHADRAILETAGMVHMEAWCGDRRLELARSITLKIPADRLDGRMQVFYGEKKHGLENWKAQGKLPVGFQRTGDLVRDEFADQVLVAEGAGKDQGGFESEVMESVNDCYVLKSTRLDFINCDRFVDEPDPVDLLVNLDKSDKVVARIVFADLKGVMPGYYFDNSHTQVKFSGIPKGKSAVVVVYSILPDHRVQWGVQPVTVGTDREVTDLAMKTTNVEELRTFLRSIRWDASQ